MKRLLKVLKMLYAKFNSKMQRPVLTGNINSATPVNDLNQALELCYKYNALEPEKVGDVYYCVRRDAITN
jgi:hypothetical protein